MPAANDFLPFANGGGANVVSQVDYAALIAGALAPGYSAGTALSEQLNKTWRQSALMSAALGQMIADYAKLDALDDGVVANLKGKLATMIASAGVPLVLDSGVANAYVGATPLPAFTALTAAPQNFVFLFRPTNTNTLASTLNMGFGVRAIKDRAGNAIAASDLGGGSYYLLEYDSNFDWFRIIGLTNSLVAAIAVANVPAASTADVNTGTSTTKFVTPLAYLDAIGFSSVKSTGTQAITYGGSITLTHGIGREALFGLVLMHCVNPSNGFTAGQLVIPCGPMANASNSYGVQVDIPNATQVRATFGANGIYIMNPSNGAMSVVAAADWTADLIVWG